MASAVSISSSLAEGVAWPGLVAASPRADPNALPNMEPPDVPEGFSLESFCDGSALKDDSSLNGVEANGFASGLSCLAGKDVSACALDFAGVPKELAPNVLPLPNPPELLLLPPSEAKPPWVENAEKPLTELVDGAVEAAAAVVLDGEAAAPKGLWLLFPLAKLENPDCPNAGFDPALDAHGEVLIPICEDWPKPKAPALPNAEPVPDGEPPNELEPNVAPPVAAGVVVDAPQGDDFWPRVEEFPKAGAAVGVVDDPKGVDVVAAKGEAVFAGAEGVDVGVCCGALSIIARPG